MRHLDVHGTSLGNDGMTALRKGIQNNNSLISVNAAGHQVSLPMSCKKLTFCTEFTEHCDYNFHGKKTIRVLGSQ